MLGVENVRWDERPKWTDAQFTEKGGPYEHAIALGNLTGKDIWLHVPIGADDEASSEKAGPATPDE